jgi:hypothetical protein
MSGLKKSSSMKTVRPRILKNRMWVERPTILPHPNPLPLGEGTAIARRDFSTTRPATSDSGDFQERTAILPLPAGEGWGEGEAANHSQCSASLKSFCKLHLPAASVLSLLLTATAASPPPNLARSAKATATSEFSGQYLAQFAVDGKIPEAGSQDDLSQAWCVRAFLSVLCCTRFQVGFRPIPKGLCPPAQGCACRAEAKRRREARATLGGQPQVVPPPTGLRPFRAVPRHNPVGVATRSLPVSQGSLARSATLGFGTESRWDSSSRHVRFTGHSTAHLPALLLFALALWLPPTFTLTTNS